MQSSPLWGDGNSGYSVMGAGLGAVLVRYEENLMLYYIPKTILLYIGK